MIILKEKKYSIPFNEISNLPLNILKNILKNYKSTVIDHVMEGFEDEIKNGELTISDFEGIHITSISFQLEDNEIEIMFEPDKNSKFKKRYNNWYWTLIFSSKTGKFLGWGD